MRRTPIHPLGLIKTAVPLVCFGLVLATCLFGSTAALAAGWLGPVMREVLAALHDPGTQWMILACCALYFAMFSIWLHRMNGGDFWRWGNPDLWLAAAVVLAALRYALSYSGVASNMEALVLLGGAALGKGAAVLKGWMDSKAGAKQGKPGKQATSNGGNVANERAGAMIVVLLLLLAGAMFWQDDASNRFQYREQSRWSGPWNNPNVFGMLMGVGLVLGLGRAVSGVRGQVSGKENEHPTSNIQHSTSNGKAWRWVQVFLFLTAAGLCGLGLVKSYSRGAWLGTLCGMAFLGYQVVRYQVAGNGESKVQSPKSKVSGVWRWWRTRTHITLNPHPQPLSHSLGEGGVGFSPRPAGGEGESFPCGSCISWFTKNWLPVSVVLVSVLVIGFWSVRHTEHPLARRVASVGNVNDFSWRNRVAAWVGSLQIMAEKPLLGLGWNRSERVYDQFYRSPKVEEGAAIQLNDYFTLGTTIGIPALVCFVAFIGLSLFRKSEVGSQKPEAPPGESGLRSLTSDRACLRSTCRAGAIVLLVGFWFDGGLFKLATGAVFWMLLALGKEDWNHEE